MNFTSTLTSKNQTTLPKKVVSLLGAKPSSILNYEVMEDGGIRLTAKSTTFADHVDQFPRRRPRRKVSVDQMNDAIRAAVAKRFLNSKA